MQEVMPRPTRYEGPLTVVNLDLNEPMNYFQQIMFVHGPCAESFTTSTRRLINALRADGKSELRPLTIWQTYRRHPELSYEE